MGSVPIVFGTAVATIPVSQSLTRTAGSHEVSISLSINNSDGNQVGDGACSHIFTRSSACLAPTELFELETEVLQQF